MGQCDHLSLALLHTCEDISIKLLDTSMLLGSVSQTPEEVCIQIFREARRVMPCIVYIPRIASLWDVMSATFRATFRSVLDSLPYDLPLMLLASTERERSELRKRHNQCTRSLCPLLPLRILV